MPNLTVHSDQHAMAWDSRVAGLVYQGDDGGFWVSTAAGVGPTAFSKGGPQPWTQLYSVDVAESDIRRVVGGAQDNGVQRSYGTGGAQTPGPDGVPAWNSYGGGDGLKTLIDPTNQNVVFGCSQYGSCSRSTNGGDSSSRIGAVQGARKNWFTPLELAPQDSKVVYYGSEVVNRSVDGGVTFTKISPDLTGGDPGKDPDYKFGTLTTIAPSPVDASVVWAGTDDGRIWRTTDLSTWTRTAPAELPGDWVTRIVASPVDRDTAWATFSGYRSGDNAAKVLRTDDGGRTWRDVGRGPAGGPGQRRGPGRPGHRRGHRRRGLPLAQRPGRRLDVGGHRPAVRAGHGRAVARTHVDAHRRHVRPWGLAGHGARHPPSPLPSGIAAEPLAQDREPAFGGECVERLLHQLLDVAVDLGHVRLLAEPGRGRRSGRAPA